MASTNQTPNYGLPIYSANDRASWVDTNQAFENIDEALKTASDNASSAASDVTEALATANEAKSSATTAASLATQANTNANTANSKADANTASISVLENTVSNQGTRLTGTEEQVELNRVAIGGVSARVTQNDSDIAELQSEIGNIPTWALLSSATGTGSITLPQNFKELLVHVYYTNNVNFSVLIPADALDATSKSWRAGFYIDSSANGGIILNATNTEIALGQCTVAGVNRTTSTTTTVYYK